MTTLLAVIGHPIAHSLSPRMHAAAIDALGLDAAYLALDVAPERLDRTVRELSMLGAIGFNVTLPHKEAIVASLDAIDGEARAIGAVNTVVREDGRWVGTNTDARGLVRSIDEAGIEVQGRRATVIGAGGAARWAPCPPTRSRTPSPPRSPSRAPARRPARDAAPRSSPATRHPGRARTPPLAPRRPHRSPSRAAPAPPRRPRRSSEPARARRCWSRPSGRARAPPCSPVSYTHLTLPTKA